MMPSLNKQNLLSFKQNVYPLRGSFGNALQINCRSLLRHRHRKRHHIAHAPSFTDLRRPQALDFIDAHNRMHGHKAAHYPFELGLELFFARIDHQLGALAKDELFHLQEAPQITLIDLLGVHFEHLALVEENHLIDWSFTFGHGGRTTHGDIKEGANYSMAPDAQR